MITSDATPILYELRDGHIALITLDRPAARNAINGVMAQELDRLVKQTEADDTIRAVVLASSHDKVFCAGADLAEIAAGKADGLMTVDGGFAGLVRARREKPWIAAVDGAAFAGGCEIMLSCDMVIASSAACFGVPEVKRGLYAGGGAPMRLVHALPRAVALELVATGDPIDAERAYGVGLVNRLVAPGTALDAAIALAATIAANAPLAVRESLAIMRGVGDMDEAEFWSRSDAAMARVFASADASEGSVAFLEKRLPVWTGR
jgi:enoyl-CoA hydratase/carnithine racemase